MKYPNWKGLTADQRTKAISAFKQLLKEGKTFKYARRIAGGLGRGETVKEARGKHPAERYHTPPVSLKQIAEKIKTKMPKSVLDKSKEEWAAYAYQDTLGFADDGEYPLSPFSMSSYDHTKTQIKNYNWQSLFEMHKHMERQVEFAFPDWLSRDRMARKEEGYADLQEDATYKHRLFEWKMFDEDGELRYWLTYEQGEFQKRQMWGRFDYFEAKMELRRLGVWG